MDADASTLRMELMHEAEKQGVVHHFLSLFFRTPTAARFSSAGAARVGVGLPARPCCTVKPRQQEPDFPAAGAVAEELIRQLFLEISVHLGAFRHDDESVGVDAAHQAQQPLDFVLGNHCHQDVGILFRIGTPAGPVGNAPLHLGENYVGDSRVLGENHHLHVDVLDEHPVQEYRQNRGVDQGIDDHFHIKDEEADTVDKNIHDDADNSDFGIGMANGHAHADDILPAAGGTSAHYHSGTASGDDAAHKAGRQGIVHDRCGRHGNQCQR